jgi:hypothetical protein
MLVFYTAGESHGRGVFAFLDGLPAGLKVDRGVIDADLARRQHGYGRGGRMAIEKDRVDVLSGIRGGITIGSPVLLAVWNQDHENWNRYMDPWAITAGGNCARHPDMRTWPVQPATGTGTCAMSSNAPALGRPPPAWLPAVS